MLISSFSRLTLTQHLARCDTFPFFFGPVQRVSLLHGKMTSAEKSKTLSEFSETDEGEGLRVLVSTSIIEVREVRERAP